MALNIEHRIYWRANGMDALRAQRMLNNVDELWKYIKRVRFISEWVPFAKYLFHLSSTLFHEQLYNFVSMREDILNSKKIYGVFKRKHWKIRFKWRFVFFSYSLLKIQFGAVQLLDGHVNNTYILSSLALHIYHLRNEYLFFFICEQMRPIFISKSHLDRNMYARAG